MADLWERIKIQYRQKPSRFILIGVLLVGIIGLVTFQRSRTTITKANDLAALTSKDSVLDAKKNDGSSRKAVEASSSSTVTTPVKYYVEIKGEVNKPNVYQVSEHARINDLVKLAGGLTAQADDRQINLAQPLQDGMSIYIPKQGEELTTAPQNGNEQSSGVPATSEPNNSSGNTQAPATININQADIVQLQQINGVGPKKAADIITYRESSGPFKSVDDLTKVSGIGDKTLAKIRDQLCV